LKTILLAVVALLSGCATAPTYQYLPSQVIYDAPLQQQGITIYSDYPLYQPAPARAQWATPPIPLEIIPYQPYPEAVWVGGYWVWQGNWVWARGRWAGQPMASSPVMTVNPNRPRQPDQPPSSLRMPPPVSNYVRPGMSDNAPVRTPATPVPAAAPQQSVAPAAPNQPKSKPEPEREKRDRRGNDDGRQNDRR
jgi:hypothetical protein